MCRVVVAGSVATSMLIIMDGERNHTWRVRWTGLPYSPKTDSDRLIKDNLSGRALAA